MSTFLRPRSIPKGTEEELGGQMSFLEHLDELRRRLIRSIIFVFVACSACWFISDRIYNFLAIPVEKALAEAQRREAPVASINGQQTISSLGTLKEGDTGRYVFPEETKMGTSVIPAGASVMSRVTKDAQGQLGLFTTKPSIPATRFFIKGFDCRLILQRCRNHMSASTIS